jgi:hypothetical protein
VAQLVAEATAAFATNNWICQQSLNLSLLDSEIMAGIIMKGTSPTFHKIRVTRRLLDCVAKDLPLGGNQTP